MSAINPRMKAEEFEQKVLSWAATRRDLMALILAGSRADRRSRSDEWADWDFHLFVKSVDRYRRLLWLKEIAPYWGAHVTPTSRGILKISVVFQDGREADFVPLAAWQMRLVYWAMQYPNWAAWMPERLRRGIHETRAFMLGSGYRVLVGDEAWRRRLEALNVPWPPRVLAHEQFVGHTAAFWPLAVWLAKRIARKEYRAAIHWMGKLTLEHVYPVLQEEARLAGNSPRPEARKAELWLNEERLRQTEVTLAPDQRILAKALLASIDLFVSAAQSVAASRGFSLNPHREIEQWLRVELGRFVGQDT
jgi:hypothetical protein